MERGAHPVDPALGLFDNLPRVVPGVHDHGIGSRTVPGFRACRVLDEVEPSIRRRHWLVLVAVPFGDARRRN